MRRKLTFKKWITWFSILVVSALACVPPVTRAQENTSVDRTVLPLTEPTYPPITELDVRKATPPPRFEVKAPDGAPNVLVIMLDNLGFGATEPFGGVIHMPTLESLAKDGLRYNNFHTAPLCSPSRVALITGRNPHSVNMGSISELATAFPGQTAERPNSVAPLAEIMKLNGYSTAMFGKSHEFAPAEIGLTGPLETWPTGWGFEGFYGTLSGEADCSLLPCMTTRPSWICRMTPTITTRLTLPITASRGFALRSL